MRILVFEELDSTNLYARDNIDKLDNLDIVLAYKQKSGRGRLNNKWKSPAGNMYASFIIKDKDILGLHLPILFSLAIKRVIHIEHEFKQICLKWPNDIYIYNKKTKNYSKLGGILSQTIEDCNIVGVGLNIKIAPDVGKYPTSCLQELALDISPKKLAILIHKELQNVFSVYKIRGFTYLKDMWLRACCHYKKQILVDDKKFTFIDLDPNGFAVLKHNNIIETVYSATIDLI